MHFEDIPIDSGRNDEHDATSLQSPRGPRNSFDHKPLSTVICTRYRTTQHSRPCPKKALERRIERIIEESEN
jgi:hypothetical protein